MSDDIREKHESQIERLVEMVKKNKKVQLTAELIREYVQREEKYVLEHFLNRLSSN